MLGITKIYLANQAADALRLSIERGDFGEYMPNIRTLARSLGISVPNVLQALSILEQEGYVLKQRGKATKIIRRKRGRKALPEGQEKTVCFIGFPPEKLYESTFFHGIADRLRELDYNVPFLQYAMKEWETVGGVADIHNRFKAQCYVLVGAPPAVQQQFHQSGHPCLLASCVPDHGISFPYLEINFTAIYRHAAHQFLSRGHRQVHLLMERKSAEKNPEAVDTFVRIIESHSPASPQSNRNAPAVLQVHDGTPEDFTRLLSRLFRNKQAHPTGLLISYVHFYVLAQSWLLRHGFRIPEEVSLISRDSSDLLDFLLPTPSHYYYNTEIAQRRNLRTIVSVIKGQRVRKATLALSEFREGETLQPPPKRG